VFQTISHCRRKYGPNSIGPYIVSMTRGPADVLAVLLLARWGNLGPKGQAVPLDIAPFFETVTDLDNIAETMYGLLRDERYRRHLQERGNHQLVMIGYGNTNQDAGIVTSFWSMHKAQQQLVETARRFGIRLTIFHGRGGAIARAGRRLHDAVRAVPHGGGTLRLRMTEQGEGISAKYGLRGIALRTLEQTTSALLQRLGDAGRPPDENLGWNRMMQTIADESRRAYRALLEESDSFMRYFDLATPIDVMDRLGLGFKGGRDDAEETAAGAERIMSSHQWEFAWTQNRCLLPAWYGFASGVEMGIDVFGEDAIRTMFTEWQFARVLIADIELTLAKADLDIAAEYSALAGDLHEHYFPRIRSEYDRSVAAVLKLTGQSKLLESSSTFRRAIRLRNPYMDPMSYLQIDLLKRWRATGRCSDDVLDALQSSINGIAHGMQNTA
jgi:phosphoenolpyruvate carboxylase